MEAHSETQDPASGPSLLPAPPESDTPVEDKVADIASLLKTLNEAAGRCSLSEAVRRSRPENRLAQARLGVAGGLFAALEAKHPPTALHALRVALGCSAWGMSMEMPDESLDVLELAALLHDVGKIGVCDAILMKAGRLSEDEAAVMDGHVRKGVDILAHCCATAAVLDAVRYVPAWYDGTKAGFDRHGKQLPIAARMIAIVDAFDAMTTDQIYRAARSSERAVAELFHFAGTQFDPDLVSEFSVWRARYPSPMQGRAASRWLSSLQAVDCHWRRASLTPWTEAQPSQENLFEQQLLNSLPDGVVFIDNRSKILRWNRGAERLTGLTQSAVEQRSWSSALLKLEDVDGRRLCKHQDPIIRAIDGGIPCRQRLAIVTRSGQVTPVELLVTPVVDRQGTTLGALLLLRDISPETSLARQCENLQQRATLDPLTGVANRAEFDHMHERFIQAHMETGLPCSLIVCDIDYFKQVNDRHGHQAGDQAIQTLAALLKNHCEKGDFVARYGGEEFVLLFADCDNVAAAQRAEHIRREFSELPLPELAGGQLTASFGVTELQAGDSPVTMFRRADRALLQAKEMGRNLVVQLGAGMISKERRKKGWWPFKRTTPSVLLDSHLVTAAPIDVTIEKLRGFIADHDARITAVTQDQVNVMFEANYLPRLSRHADRSVPFLMELKFSQQSAVGSNPHTHIHVVVRPKRSRERRREQSTERARQVMASLRAYLMVDKAVDDRKGSSRRSKRTRLPWLPSRD